MFALQAASLNSIVTLVKSDFLTIQVLVRLNFPSLLCFNLI